MASEGRRFLSFLRKPLLVLPLPCCGSVSHVSAPVDNRVAPQDINRRESFRPSALSFARDEPIARSEEASDAHPYHCPICFNFFAGLTCVFARNRRAPYCALTAAWCAEMNRTECCKHHLCRDCALEIMERIPAFRANYAQETVREAAPCPHCGDENLRLSTIRTREEARNYNDSPAVLSRTRVRQDGLTPGRLSVQASPLKVGDSMENMMRKMLTYDQCGINIKAEQRISIVGDMTTPGRDSPPLCEYVNDPNNPGGLPGVPFPPLPEDILANEDGDARSDVRSPAETEVQDRSPSPPLAGHVARTGAQEQGRRLSESHSESSLSGSGTLRPLPPVLNAEATGVGVVAGRPPLPSGSRSLSSSRSRSRSPLAIPASPAATGSAQAITAPAVNMSPVRVGGLTSPLQMPAPGQQEAGSRPSSALNSSSPGHQLWEVQRGPDIEVAAAT